MPWGPQDEASVSDVLYQTATDCESNDLEWASANRNLDFIIETNTDNLVLEVFTHLFKVSELWQARF